MRSSIFLFSILLLLVSCIKEDDENYPVPDRDIEVNDKIPAFIVYENDNQTGSSFNSKEFAGKVSLLVFFNTECKDCQRELPVLNRVWEALKDEPDFQMVTIARQQTRRDVVKYWEQENFTMPSYLDPDRTVYGLFAAQTIPRIYLINKESVVTWIAIEKLTVTDEQIIEMIYAQNKSSI